MSDKIFQNWKTKKIRLDQESGVSHFCTKYYHVVHDTEIKEDHLKLIDSKKILYKVKALHQDGNTTVYKVLP